MLNYSMYFRVVFISIVMSVLSSCAVGPLSKVAVLPDTIENFPNVLDIRNAPLQPEDWAAFAFFDQGAWFGFALPPDGKPEYQGVFPGPFVSTHGRWLGQHLLGLSISDLASGQPVNLAKAEQTGLQYYPGRLVQQYRFAELQIELTLIFISNRVATIQATLRNMHGQSRSYRLEWTGKPFEIAELPLQQSVAAEHVSWTFGEKKQQLLLSSPGSEAAGLEGNGYKLSTPALLLPAGSSDSRYLNIVFAMSPQDQPQIDASLQEFLRDAPAAFASNRARWNRYLDSILDANSPWAKLPAYRQIAVKALLTLVNNWKSAYADLVYDGLLPSYAVRYFDGFWSWDSWKHAVALSRFDKDIAENQVRALFAYQNARGMVPDVIYPDKRDNNWRDTKPPLAAWAVWEIYAKSGDAAFVQEMLPKLLKYHRWWYQDRDHDNNGLCEFGSTDGSIEAALWESGMDDAVRYDDRKMLKNSEEAWSLDLESVDLNAYLYAEKLYLSKLAEVLGKQDLISQLQSEAVKLKQSIQSAMFSEASGFFHDVNLQDKSIHDSFGPEGWTPLWAEVASPEQAMRVRDVILNPGKFNTYMPLPTVSKDNSRFMTGYWRGPVWLDQAYFGIKGLRNYGLEKEAQQLTKALFDHAEGLRDSGPPIRENYDPRDGKGLKVNHFSWSAAHLLLLYWWE